MNLRRPGLMPAQAGHSWSTVGIKRNHPLIMKRDRDLVPKLETIVEQDNSPRNTVQLGSKVGDDLAVSQPSGPFFEHLGLAHCQNWTRDQFSASTRFLEFVL